MILSSIYILTLGIFVKIRWVVINVGIVENIFIDSIILVPKALCSWVFKFLEKYVNLLWMFRGILFWYLPPLQMFAVGLITF